MNITLPNRKKVTLENVAVFGEFSVGDIPAGGCAIVFNGACYDTRSNRTYAEWCASRFDPAHARRNQRRA